MWALSGIQLAAMTTAETPLASAPAAGSPASGFFARIWEWIWRGEALREARTRPKLSWLGRERLRRARLAAELGDRALDPVEPLRAGSPLPLAISLYREAAYWALIQPGDTSGVATLREAFETSKADLTRAAGGADRLAAVRSALIEKSAIETADDTPETQRREADLAQAFVYKLIDSDVDRDDRVADMLIQRWLRVLASALVLTAVLFGLVVALRHATTGPDLAQGKPWRASSKEFECHPENTQCGGARSAILFHTTEENSPWLEVDLGSPQDFRKVTVVNREDCCSERAFPMIIEVGNDQKTWKEVAKITENFREWDGSFSPVKARYVRFRVDRRSILHLIRVSVWN
jgi:hypothetical protein